MKPYWKPDNKFKEHKQHESELLQNKYT